MDKEEFFSEKLLEIYNGFLAKIPLIISPHWAGDFPSLCHNIAGKNANLTLAKPPFFYSLDLVRKYESKIMTYDFNLAAGCYQVIIQISKKTHLLLSLIFAENREYHIGWSPVFMFENGNEYLNFIEENKEYKKIIKNDQGRVGF